LWLTLITSQDLIGHLLRTPYPIIARYEILLKEIAPIIRANHLNICDALQGDMFWQLIIATKSQNRAILICDDEGCIPIIAMLIISNEIPKVCPNTPSAQWPGHYCAPLSALRHVHRVLCMKTE